MTRPRKVQLLCVLLAAGGVAMAGALQAPLDAMRVAMDRAGGEELTGQYPELVLLQAMPGNVRALAIDYLWIRSETIKQEGRFYDSMQLSKLICMLQPRFPDVWANRAWNLAYNISVTESTPRARWRWITDGISLLRDKGLHYNPKSLTLYRELSWIYFHKVGGTTDEMHRYYKRLHAGEFHRILGSPPTLGWEESYDQWFGRIVDAPETESELVAEETVAAYVQRLGEADLHLDIGLLDAYRVWGDDPRVRMVGDPPPPADDPNKETYRALLAGPADREARQKVVAFVRRKILTETYHMKPSWMKKLSDQHGPLDWRLVWPHAIYWSSYGLYHCKNIDPTEITSLNTARTVLNSLKSIFAAGRIILGYNPEAPDMPFVEVRPDLRFIAACHKMHIDIKEFITGKSDGKTYRQFEDGHINFLITGLTALWMAGRVDEADKYYQYIRKTYEPTDPKWQLSLDDFVRGELRREGIDQEDLAVTMVHAALGRSYYAALAGDEDEYALQTSRAYALYAKYNRDVPDRTRLAAWEQMRANAAIRFLFEGRPEVASTLWQKLPFEIQRWCYDYLAARLKPPYVERKLNFDALFPEPPGMDEFRRARQAG